MTLGEKLKQARLDAGLSQRQLCGDTITRNMLSQIENGSARPSMDTLLYLASRLEKPIGYFLEEDGATTPNLQAITAAREAWARRDAGEVLTALENYQKPDPIFDGEYGLLWNLATLEKAKGALEEGRKLYVAALLEKLEDSPYMDLLKDDLALLRWRMDKSVPLPKRDSLLMAKAEQAMEKADYFRAQVLLDACEEKSDWWHFLRGENYFMAEAYAQAAEQFRLVEDTYGPQVYGRLEICYKAMDDYKMAYVYACKARE